jgi:4-diphosphocytidyl-2-C-methyl-D-erythritol kinase
MATEAFAAAKVNLCLHVVGQRADGYHLLDSLVAFAGVGDRVTVAPAAGLTLAVEGPQGAALGAGEDNLVLRAARAFGPGRGAEMRLFKHLPVASGIGGGSADAAAALRALAELWGLPLPDAATVLGLGADVPVCLHGRAVRMGGVGEVLGPVPPLPAAWIVLANPGVQVATPAVFAALKRKDNPGLPEVPAFADLGTLAKWLMLQRNDLEAPALVLAPVIARVLEALAAQPGARVARMSGSGATCFALFARQAEAAAAAAALARPGWWTAAAPLLP